MNALSKIVERGFVTLKLEVIYADRISIALGCFVNGL